MNGSGFRDRFGAAAPAYAAFRPRYPPELFAALAAVAPGRELAWDCATGTGQAALGLAAHFERVIATDASAAQLAAAQAHPRVSYHRAVAEASGIEAGSAALVTVAQALHWLDRPRFFAEARRVLVPGGVVAVWCYESMEIGPEIDEIVRHYYSTTVGPYWAAERALVESGYRTIDFPFDEFPLPPARIEAQLSCADLAGYVGTWSATLRYREATGHDPLPALVASLNQRWGPPGAVRRVRWPLSIRAGRVGG